MTTLSESSMQVKRRLLFYLFSVVSIVMAYLFRAAVQILCGIQASEVSKLLLLSCCADDSMSPFSSENARELDPCCATCSLQLV